MRVTCERDRFHSNLLLFHAQAKNCSPEKIVFSAGFCPGNRCWRYQRTVRLEVSAPFSSNLPRERRKERPFELVGAVSEKARGDAAAAVAASALGRSWRSLMPVV